MSHMHAHIGIRNKAHTIINASFNKFQDNSNNAALVTLCVCLVVIKFELCLVNRHLFKKNLTEASNGNNSRQSNVMSGTV